MLDGGAHVRDGAVEVPAPSPLAGQVDLDEGQVGQEVHPTLEHVTDIGEHRLPAVAHRVFPAVDQRDAQCHPGDGQRDIVTGTLGDLQSVLDLAERAILGRQDTGRDARAVDVGDHGGIGHGIGAAGHRQTMLEIFCPPRTPQAIARVGAGGEGHRQGQPMIRAPIVGSPSARAITRCDQRSASDHSAHSLLA